MGVCLSASGVSVCLGGVCLGRVSAHGGVCLGDGYPRMQWGRHHSVNRMTGVKTLPCSKRHLRAVTRRHFSRMPTIRLPTDVCTT